MSSSVQRFFHTTHSKTQKTHNKKPLAKSPLANIAAAALLTVGVAAASTSALALTPYSADYTFSIDGKYNGSATRTLVKKTDNKWDYEFTASVPIVARASQSSTFVNNGGALLPLTHATTYKILVHKRTTKLDFDYKNKQVHVDDKGDKKTYPLSAPALDDLTLELQIREDLSRGKLKSSYRVADEDEIDNVTFKNLGRTKITVPAGTFEVIKLQRVHANPKRKTYFWLSPKHDYLPIKMQQDDKGKIYDSELKRIN